MFNVRQIPSKKPNPLKGGIKPTFSVTIKDQGVVNFFALHIVKKK